MSEPRATTPMGSRAGGSPIVVGVDGSASARRAAVWAADRAALRNRPLRLVLADNEYVFGGGMVPPQSFFDAIQASGEKALDDVASVVLARHPRLEIDEQLVSAGPVLTLVEQSVDAAMLVVGSRGNGGFRGILVGSTAVALVAHALCPVAVIRGAAPESDPPADGPVVVGVDGSDVGEAAIAAAFDEATWRGADLVAVHSWLGVDPDHVRPIDTRWAEQGEQELLAERMAGWQEKYPDVTVRRVVVAGSPADALIEHATGAQLLVVGSRGHGVIGGRALGSTSQAMIHHSPCPLLVVRPTSS